MSDGRAIAAIGAALAAILQPVGDIVPTLYRITPNSRARNARPLPGSVVPRATAIDLHYLVAGENTHQLGRAITTLAAHPVLTGAGIDSLVTETDLHGAVPADEILQVTLETLTIDEASTLWRALGQPLKPALYLVVGPAMLA